MSVNAHLALADSIKAAHTTKFTTQKQAFQAVYYAIVDLLRKRTSSAEEFRSQMSIVSDYSRTLEDAHNTAGAALSVFLFILPGVEHIISSEKAHGFLEDMNQYITKQQRSIAEQRAALDALIDLSKSMPPLPWSLDMFSPAIFTLSMYRMLAILHQLYSNGSFEGTVDAFIAEFQGEQRPLEFFLEPAAVNNDADALAYVTTIHNLLRHV